MPARLPCGDLGAVHVRDDRATVAVGRAPPRRVFASGRRDGASFEDRSKLRPPVAANVEVTGAAAIRILDALTAARVRDDDGTLSLVCGAANGPPTCSHWSYPNGLGTPTTPTRVDAAAAQALWSAITNAGETAGIGIDGDAHAPPTILNARSFTWDGTTLRLHLVLSNVKPPAAQPSL
jgi:hypothetical protein